MLIYVHNQFIEEASTEFLQQQICKTRKILFEPSYEKLTRVLQVVNNHFHYGTDLEFAKELFHIPLPDRYEWLRNKVSKSLKKQKVSFDEYSDVMGFVNQLEGGMFE